MQVTLPDGKIQDFIDGKIRNDTPEEYVRQNIEKRLVLELGYDPKQIAVEFPIQMGSGRKRADIVVFPEGAPHEQDTAWIVIECKEDSVPLSDRKEGLGQLKSYLTACPNAEWGLWTNGKQKAVVRKIRTEEGIIWEEPNDIPALGEDPSQIDRPTRDSLRQAVEDNLLYSFRVCHDHIYVTDGLQKQPAFFELLKVIFCKIQDERNEPHPLEFYATAKEKGSGDGRLTVKNRIGRIFSRVKKEYPNIFDTNDEIKLDPRSLSYVVGELQRYSFIDTDIDVKGKAYEEIVGANLRGDRGEFFTPRNVQAMAIDMLHLKAEKEERLLDPSCGTGGFLVIAMNRIVQQFQEQAGEGLSEARRFALREQIRATARKRFFGIDINPDLVKATKMNMVMNNDGAGNILRQDSLRHPHEWDSAFRSDLAKALDIDPGTLRGPDDLGHFDVIASNPPFGSRLPIKDTETLKQFRLARVWQDESGWMTPTDSLQTSMPPEILFIERCWQFLKPGGRMAIVLPDAILGAPGLRYVRFWMLQYCRLIASVDLHPDTFQPRNGTQTSVLFLQRKTAHEIQETLLTRNFRDYDVFMAEVKAIGHDKRGNHVYKRNEHGEELLFDPPQNVRRMNRTANGNVSTRPLPRQKQRDDDTPVVARDFLRWKAEEVLGW